MSAPIPCRWSGESFEPLRRFKAECDKTFVIGEVYRLETHEERSAKSHAHFFAQLADAWSTLPEEYDGRWATPEHFRKWLLIQTGHADHRQHVCHTRGEAVRLRAALAPMDSYAVVTLTGCVVDVYTAQSMSSRAMDRKAFQGCKDAIFAKLDEMLGVASGVAQSNTARAA